MHSWWEKFAWKFLFYPGWLDCIVVFLLFFLVSMGFGDSRLAGLLGGACRYLITQGLYPRAFVVVTATRKLQLISIVVFLGYLLIAPDAERFALTFCSYCGVVSSLVFLRAVILRSVNAD